MNIPTESIHVRQADYTDLVSVMLQDIHFIQMHNHTLLSKGAHPLLSEDPSFANGN